MTILMYLLIAFAEYDLLWLLGTGGWERADRAVIGIMAAFTVTADILLLYTCKLHKRGE